jgi:hypothetical protein
MTPAGILLGSAKAGVRQTQQLTRVLIDTGRSKMFANQNAQGRFTEMDEVALSPSADRRRSAKTTVIGLENRLEQVALRCAQ